jgi:hypothetical protein
VGELRGHRDDGQAGTGCSELADVQAPAPADRDDRVGPQLLGARSQIARPVLIRPVRGPSRRLGAFDARGKSLAVGGGQHERGLDVEVVEHARQLHRGLVFGRVRLENENLWGFHGRY